MRILLFVSALLFTISVAAQCRTEMNGIYTGKNVYVQNPATANGNWCTDSLQINGKPYAFEKASAFEIRSDSTGLHGCDSLQLVFFHACDCKPKLITEMHPPAGKTTFTSISIYATGLLHWSASFDCSGYAPLFAIETERWGAWQQVAEMPQQVNPSGNYSCRVPLYAGENKFRVIVKDHYSKSQTISRQVVINSNKPPVTWQYDAVKDIITFSDSTGYKIVNTKEETVAFHRYAQTCNLRGIKRKSSLRMYYANAAEPVAIPRTKKKKKTFTLSLPM